jgi:hypothetical protein
MVWTNLVIHGGNFDHPNQLIRNAKMELEEFQRVHKRQEERGVASSTRNLVSWQAPLNINWDAAVDKKGGKVGVGIIARYHNRKCLIAYSLIFMMNIEPVVAKAYAALHAIMMGRDFGAQGIVFEGDALQMVNAVNSNQISLSSFGHFIEDIQSSLKKMRKPEFIHVMREGNSVAHGLACKALVCTTDHV